MAIYTRSGDTGTTSLFGGKRICKYDSLIEAYGEIDELSSFLGLLFFYSKKKSDKKEIAIIQKDLYLIMGHLAGAQINLNPLTKRTFQFEKEMDILEKNLPALHQFILPQGSLLSVYAHISRTVCRRAERSLVKYYASQQNKQSNSDLILSYINRLSDFLYIKARKYNQKQKGEVVV